MTNSTYAIAQLNSVSMTIFSLSLMLFLGFAVTRLTKKLRLPNVTAYIVAGILIGPFCFNIIPAEVIDRMNFLPDIALTFIAFSTGEFFRYETLKKNGLKVVVITLFDACLATVLVFSAAYWLLHLNFVFSVVLAALASATAPASTMMTIRQTNAKGDFVETLLQVVALDDVIGLIVYSVAISFALSVKAGTCYCQMSHIIIPIAVNVGIIILGGVFGVFMKLLMSEKRSTDNRLIVSISLLFAFCGICAVLDESPLLGCMAMSTVYINISNDEKLYKQLNYFTPPILLLFFVRSGISFRLDALLNSSTAAGASSLLVIGLVYFFVRMFGKYAGAFIGSMITGKSNAVRNYLGFALIPQAGVAIGLAAIGRRALGGQAGMALETVVLTSSILYEFIGPAAAKLALYLSHSYDTTLEAIVPDEKLDADTKGLSAAELLIRRIQVIQDELAQNKTETSDDEQAFLDAADDQIAAFNRMHTKTLRHRRH